MLEPFKQQCPRIKEKFITQDRKCEKKNFEHFFIVQTQNSDLKI